MVFIDSRRLEQQNRDGSMSFGGGYLPQLSFLENLPRSEEIAELPGAF